MNVSQNLCPEAFSAWSSSSIINLIKMSKTNVCEGNSSPMILIGNQMHDLREDITPCSKMRYTNMATQISHEKCDAMWIRSITSHLKLQNCHSNVRYVSVPKWRQSFKMLWMKMSGHWKTLQKTWTHEIERVQKKRFWQVFGWKILKIMNVSQNLCPEAFSAWSSSSIINLIKMSKTNVCEGNSSPMKLRGNQMVYSWNHGIISLAFCPKPNNFPKFHSSPFDYTCLSVERKTKQKKNDMTP